MVADKPRRCLNFCSECRMMPTEAHTWHLKHRRWFKIELTMQSHRVAALDWSVYELASVEGLKPHQLNQQVTFPRRVVEGLPGRVGLFGSSRLGVFKLKFRALCVASKPKLCVDAPTSLVTRTCQ